MYFNHSFQKVFVATGTFQTGSASGSGAVFTATLGAGGAVTGLVQVAGGTNYVSGQVNVTLVGGNGVGATAGAITVALGAVTAIAVGTGGSGYSVAPTVVITPTNAGGDTFAQLTGAGTLGNYGLYDAKTFKNISSASGIIPAEAGKPFIFASSSLTPATDKVGPFHGGYAESNKSKVINPKYIKDAYVVAPKAASQAVTYVGQTATTAASPYNCACPNFLCGETYYLRIDIKGSPALRFLNHNAYQVLCSSTTPNEVDPSLVMIGWAKQIAGTQTSPFNDANPILSPFVLPVVQTKNPSTGVWTYWSKDGGNVTINGSVIATSDWDTYVTPAGVAAADVCAGLILAGAYVDTRFGDCSFQPTDYFEKEPIQVYASEVDETGDPCIFQGLCVKRGSGSANDPATAGLGPVLGIQGEGFGETIVRDLILSERYRQNDWNDDPRIREITLGDAPLTAISRTASYWRYVIQHSVPRFNNPTGTFDNDQYTLHIITSARQNAAGGFEADLADILSAGGRVDLVNNGLLYVK
jgi:hypothetical protein